MTSAISPPARSPETKAAVWATQCHFSTPPERELGRMAGCDEAMVAGYAEVGVEGEDRGFGPEFGHADEEGVGEANGDVGNATARRRAPAVRPARAP